LGTPAITQNHAITADGIVTTPVEGIPALSQNHAMAATGETTTPVLDTPAVAQIHALTGDGTSTTPALSTPAVSQNHALGADGIAATPSLDSPALVSGAVLYGLDRMRPSMLPWNLALALKTARKPSHPAPAGAVDVALVADGLTTTPSLDQPALTSEPRSAPMASQVAAANPMIMKPLRFIFEGSRRGFDETPPAAAIALTADGISVASTLGTAALSQAHVLGAGEITVAPVLAQAPLVQLHFLTGSGIVSGTPVLGAPILSIEGLGGGSWSRRRRTMLSSRGRGV
jgi:hypothetical protein